MAKNKKQSWFRKFLSFFGKRSSRGSRTEDRKKQPKSLAFEWEQAFEKFKKKLPTRQISSGIVFEKPNIRLTKNSEKMFKLEGSDFSIAILTGNYLQKTKDGKWGGVLILDEGELNQRIQRDIPNLQTFLDSLSIPKTDLILEDEGALSDWRVIFEWEQFWKEQLLLTLSPNTLALAILALGDECQRFFETVATKRQKDLVRDEFFYLNLDTGDSSNPFSKAKNLYGFSKALLEFGAKVKLIEDRRKKENGY